MKIGSHQNEQNEFLQQRREDQFRQLQQHYSLPLARPYAENLNAVHRPMAHAIHNPKRKGNNPAPSPPNRGANDSGCGRRAPWLPTRSHAASDIPSSQLGMDKALFKAVSVAQSRISSIL